MGANLKLKIKCNKHNIVMNIISWCPYNNWVIGSYY